MNYIDRVRDLVDTKSTSGGPYEHYLADIVKDVKRHGHASRDFVLINNIIFLRMSEFKGNWRNELKRFCTEFNMNSSSSHGGQTIDFHNKR